MSLGLATGALTVTPVAAQAAVPTVSTPISDKADLSAPTRMSTAWALCFTYYRRYL